MLTSNDAQTIIRTARKEWRCDCHLSYHDHPGDQPFGTAGHEHGRWCPNVIRPGDRYPEYLGETPAFQSGHRFCPDCRKDQLGDWISE
jgi:hypothetical protein